MGSSNVRETGEKRARDTKDMRNKVQCPLMQIEFKLPPGRTLGSILYPSHNLPPGSISDQPLDMSLDLSSVWQRRPLESVEGIPGHVPAMRFARPLLRVGTDSREAEIRERGPGRPRSGGGDQVGRDPGAGTR